MVCIGDASKSQKRSAGGGSGGAKTTSNNSPISATAKSKVSKTKLLAAIKIYGFNSPKGHSQCLKGWKLAWLYAGIGEYNGVGLAKNFGPSLIKYGFKVVATGNGEEKPAGYTPQFGDTRVWDSYPGQPSNAGHIDWWNGTHWVSDFTQPNEDEGGHWAPGKAYRDNKTSYKIYR